MSNINDYIDIESLSNQENKEKYNELSFFQYIQKRFKEICIDNYEDFNKKSSWLFRGHSFKKQQVNWLECKSMQKYRTSSKIAPVSLTRHISAESLLMIAPSIWRNHKIVVGIL